MTSQAIVATSPTGPGDIQVPVGLYLPGMPRKADATQCRIDLDPLI